MLTYTVKGLDHYIAIRYLDYKTSVRAGQDPHTVDICLEWGGWGYHLYYRDEDGQEGVEEMTHSNGPYGKNQEPLTEQEAREGAIWSMERDPDFTEGQLFRWGKRYRGTLSLDDANRYVEDLIPHLEETDYYEEGNPLQRDGQGQPYEVIA